MNEFQDGGLEVVTETVHYWLGGRLSTLTVRRSQRSIFWLRYWELVEAVSLGPLRVVDVRRILRDVFAA
jgi:hypothetical protein